MFGFSSADAAGASLDIIIPEWLRKRHWDRYRKVMAIGESRYGHGDIVAVPARRSGAALAARNHRDPLSISELRSRRKLEDATGNRISFSLSAPAAIAQTAVKPGGCLTLE